MLLLYQPEDKKPLTEERIYIPLCFYFIGKSGRNDAESKTIYIPLCFYFIINVSVSEIDEYFIYIPLCFYFIPPSDHIDFDVFQIYIPLCFYFICDFFSDPGRFIRFTFHYASTLSTA